MSNLELKNSSSRDLCDLVHITSWSSLTQMVSIQHSEIILMEGVCYFCPANFALVFGVTSGLGWTIAWDEEQLFPVSAALTHLTCLGVSDCVWRERSLHWELRDLALIPAFLLGIDVNFGQSNNHSVSQFSYVQGRGKGTNNTINEYKASRSWRQR